MIGKILITGASSGVGMSIAKKYLEEGYELILLARRKKLSDLFKDFNNVHVYKVDLSNEIELNSVLDEIIKCHGFIPYLVNCAGILYQSSITNLDNGLLEKSLKTNALGPIQVIKKCMPLMIKNNFGRIINLTSGAPLNCFPNFGAYSGSKALLNSLTVTMARELAQYNIKINLMSPGPVKSEMSPDALLLPEICHPTVDYLLNLEAADATGNFYWLGYQVPLFPDLTGVDWLNGIGNEKLIKIL